MCDPVTATFVTLSIAQAGASTWSQNEQTAAQNEALEQTAENQHESDVFNYANLVNEWNESERLAEADKKDRVMQSRREVAKLRAMGVEAGALGNSFDKLKRDTYMRAGLDVETIDRNLSTSQADISGRAIGQRIQSNQQYASLRTQRASGVNPLVAGLQIGAAGAQGYYMGKSLTSKPTATKPTGS